ncbi:M20/M25/M40 family metallo-hydrolase [Sphingomonas lycopersici]|uniref:Vacuolar membrane protease n=1 Tax=Sphingomonas lycopersici TaxID=2951807 RepID=A0AA41ZBF4_9SPHN|nr:M20/M25/M40 family metallo-hydrolase [Sphingomonas lycopersici]
MIKNTPRDTNFDAGRWGWLAPLCALALGLILAAIGCRLPTPVPANASASVFSAKRAMVDVSALAREPHPTGSSEISRVRIELIRRLTDMGLIVQERPAVGISTNRHFTDIAIAGNVRNIVAELPGRDPGLPAIALMAHYDTVPNSPGAADDTAGVAAILEIIRNLKASGPHLRSVILILTDGEEPGLLGSSAFFSADPLKKRLGTVINLEARGDRGRAAMFEMSPDSAPLLAQYATYVSSPSADSFASALYRQMPNDTDLTSAMTHGFVGLNIAFAGGQLAYHTSVATPGDLNQGSLQHMGDQALAMTRALADSRVSAARGRDPVYSDLFGLILISYPLWMGWLLIAGCAIVVVAGTILALRAGRLTASGVAYGAASFLLLALFCALILRFGTCVTDFMFRTAVSPHALYGQFDLLLAAAATLSAGAALFALGAQQRARWVPVTTVALLAGAICCALRGPDLLAISLALIVMGLAPLAFRRPRSLYEAWVGAQLVALTTALAAQIFIPQGSHLVSWPLLLVALTGMGWMLLGEQRPRARWIAVPTSGLAIGLSAAQAYGFFVAAGPTMPMVVLPFAIIGGLIILPLAWLARRSTILAGAACIAAGATLIATAAIRAKEPTPTAPHMTEAFFIADPARGRFYRASLLPKLDPWSSDVLNLAGDRPQRVFLPRLFDAPIWLARAQPAKAQAPLLAITARTQATGTQLTMSLHRANGGRALILRLRPSVPLTGVAVQGRRLERTFPAGKWSQISYYASGDQPVSISAGASTKGQLSASLMEVCDGWPASATPPAKPANIQPFRRSDTSIVVRTVATGW